MTTVEQRGTNKCSRYIHKRKIEQYVLVEKAISDCVMILPMK